MRISSHSYPLALALLLAAQPARSATLLTGRANPFKPLILKRAPLPETKMSLPPVLLPEAVEAPQLVGIIADSKGALAALKIHGKTELLRLNEPKGGVRLISLQKASAVLEMGGRTLHLTLNEGHGQKELDTEE